MVWLRKKKIGWDIAIDLGTANTRIYSAGYGLVADQPSGPIHHCPRQAAEGARLGAQDRHYSDPESSPPPLRSGAIANLTAAVSFLAPLIRRSRPRGQKRCRVLSCAPSDATLEECRLLSEAIRHAGAAEVTVVSAPLAGLLGAINDIESPYAQMLVDIGDGVTDIAVIRSSTVIAAGAVRLGCNSLPGALCNLMMKRYGLIMEWNQAETAVRTLGSAPGTGIEGSMISLVHSPAHWELTTFCVSSALVKEAIEKHIRAMVSGINRLIRVLSDQVACEVIESGICLTGGGARLAGMAGFISTETSLDVKIAHDPMHAVINGAGRMITDGFHPLTKMESRRN